MNNQTPHQSEMKADTAPLLEALSTLSDFLKAGKLPPHLLDLLLRLLDGPRPAGSRISSIATAGQV